MNPPAPTTTAVDPQLAASSADVPSPLLRPERPPRRDRRPARRGLAREQGLLLVAQATAGLGNLGFALVAARLLPAGQFAALVAFLAAYLLLHLPAGSLSAGAAVDPTLAGRATRRTARLGVGVGVALALLAVPLSGPLNLPVGLVLALAAAAPGVGPLALARGRLFGEGRRGSAAASLLTEPLVRLLPGLALATAVGVTAAAAAVVAAGYLALAVAVLAARRGPAPLAPPTGDRPAVRPTTTVAAFLLLAVVQTQDVLLANALLGTQQAAVFAALSTLGGLAVFATATIPLVLLPRAARGTPRALLVAAATAALVGGAVVAAVALAPASAVTALLGEQYAEVSGLALPYLAAMALLGVVRVATASRTATGAGRPLVVLLALAAASQTVGVLLLGRSAEAVALVTLAVVAVLASLVAAVLLAAAARAEVPPAHAKPAPAGRWRGTLAVVGQLTVLGLLLRLSVTRSLWLDEATSWRQSQLPFDALMFDLATTDVHPPLWGTLLWSSVRVVGDGELALRLPSILAGTALVPLLYLAGRDLFSRRTGLVAAALGTVSPLAVWYGQEARMYGLFMTLSVLSLWTLVRAVRAGRFRWWAAYTSSTAALLYTQWFAVLPVAVQLVGLLVLVARRRRRGQPVRRLGLGTAGAVVGLAALLLPVAPYLQEQLLAYANRGAGFATPSQAGAGVGVSTGAPELGIYTPMVNVAWALGGFHDPQTMTLLVSLWPLALLLGLALLGRGLSSRTALLLGVAAVPPVALFAVAQFKPDLFELRYFVGTVPVLVLLLAHAVVSWTGRTRAAVLLTAVLVAVGSVALYDQQTGGENPRRYDFREAVQQVSTQVRPGDVVVHAPDYLDNVVRYYGPDLDARPLGDGELPPPEDGGVFLLQSFADRSEVTSAVSDARVALEDQGRTLVATYRSSNVTVWEYR